MDKFSAKFSLTSVANNATPGDYNVVARVLDNTGVFYADAAAVGDTVYIDGNALSLGALRYKIQSITSATGINLTAVLRWDGGGATVEPFGDGIIGYADAAGATALPSMSVNVIDEFFINQVNNAEKFRLSAQVATVDGGSF